MRSNHRLLLITFCLFFLNVSAQLSTKQLGQIKDLVSSRQIEQLRNDPLLRQDAIRRAKASGATEAQIQQGLEELNATQTARPLDFTDGAASQRLADPNTYSSDPYAVPSYRYLQDLLLLDETTDKSKTVFGSEIFMNKDLNFQPSYNIATPKDYQLAAGDEVKVHIWGSSQDNSNYIISPEGTIVIDMVGPVCIAGMQIAQAEEHLQKRLTEIYTGLQGDQPDTFISLSLGQIRNVKVNIIGEVNFPGTYSLSSLSTLFNALYLAGGVNEIGSLRQIELYRNSKCIARLDVYDFLLKGISEANVRLEDNDMILVKPYIKRVHLSGKIKRPRIFELLTEETLQDMIGYAGNYRGDAYQKAIRVWRKNGRMRTIYNVQQNDLNTFLMQDGDSVFVDSVINRFSNRIILEGAVYRGGEYAWTEDMTIKSLLQNAEGTRPDAYMGRALLIRRNTDDSEQVLTIALGDVLQGKIADVLLKPEDRLRIFSVFETREAYTVTIQGAVNKPQTIPYQENMSVGDLILLAGGLKESAALVKAEVNRRTKDPLSGVQNAKLAGTFVIDLDPDKSGKESSFTLEPFDVVNIRYSPAYNVQKSVEVEGEVLFGGTYVMNKKNERISDLIMRAGGLSADAYIRGASLHRKVSDADKNRIHTVMRLTQSSLSTKDTINLSLIDIDNYIVGIDLSQALAHPGSSADIVLQEGDKLFIPQYMGTVKISGAVLYPNTVSFSKGNSLKRYLDQAGSYSDNARRRPIVIYANGTVGVTKKRLFWKKYPRIEPGAEIVVPMKNPNNSSLGIAEILGLTNSTVSLAAIITSMLNTIK